MAATSSRSPKTSRRSQRRVSLYLRSDFIRERMLNTITTTLLSFMPPKMMEERIAKYGIRL